MNTIDRKQIFSWISGKFWGNFFQDCWEDLYNVVPFDGQCLFVSGGYFARKFIGAPIRDIDVYVNHPSPKYFKGLVEDYERLGWQAKQVLNQNYTNEKDKYLIELSNDSEKFKIELINFHQPKSIKYIETFDFSICQIAMDQDYVYFNGNNILEDLENKKLVYTQKLGNKTVSRVAKYSRLGFELEDYGELITNDIKKAAIKEYLEAIKCPTKIDIEF